ncbi:hypothetical protein CDD82_2475 [Ophiocordyceps australis]|uniref:RING-type domain-containing protein n=1 Tax=Ophiocordyceps australis TaxID=1399860 RepID=A0A2C5ZHM7_9HYPO|nr:hypothetical protein CDD82_2475 [Ophiocordyceps australis]
MPALASPRLTFAAALTEIRNGVLLFSNPVWDGSKTVPSTLVRNISALSSQLGYEDFITSNLTTLSTNNAPKLDGIFGGLLFVPRIDSSSSCDAQQYDFIPRNVTRREQLPPRNFNMVALAPWFSIDCARAYLDSAAHSPVRALIFFKPNNSTNRPQDVDSPVWSLDDDGAWTKKYHYPIFAVPGLEGQKMMTQLSLYSGSVNQVPHGEQLSQLYGPNPNDFVRIWTDLTMENQANTPAVWAFVLIVIGALLLIITAVSLIMHFIQRRNRNSLKRRVRSGEVDLEAMGIKRLTVPAAHVDTFALFTYNAEPDITTVPPSPTVGSLSSKSRKPSRKSRRSDPRTSNKDTPPTASTRSVRSIRSKRSSITGTGDTTATNFQPNCQICLLSFEHCKTIIRELPCGHIFHPPCIDEFLTQNSSLCPMCKHCMLPQGYSPKITNGMVRREQAVRRLRERVDLDSSSLESGEPKLKEWGKRLFNYSGHTSCSKPPSPPDVPMASLPATQNGVLESSPPAHSQGNDAAPEAPSPTLGDEVAMESASTSDPSQPPTSTRTARCRKFKPRPLNLLPTHLEESESKETSMGRLSPSSFARERMRQLAAKNAPIDDPDHQRPYWRRVLSKAFPGF